MPIQQTYSHEEEEGAKPNSRSFTDRLSHVQAFAEELESQENDEHRVLVYHGVGGIGKTRLLNEFGKILDGRSQKAEEMELAIGQKENRQSTWWAKMDFEEPRRRKPPQALYYLRSRFREKYGLKFPTFDLAFTEYWSKAHEASLSESTFPMLEEHGDLILAVANLVEDVPGVGVLTKIPKRLGQLSREARRWYHKRNEEALQELPNLPPHEIKKRLPSFWTYDFNRELSNQKTRGVILIDTYEALRENRRDESQRHRTDEWVREWVAGLPGTLVVVGGRDRIFWPEIDEDWEEALHQRLVGDLSEPDMREFLAGSGIEDQGVRDQIVQAASGVPYDLELAADLHREIRACDEEPVPEDFGETPFELSQRFFQYLRDEETAVLELLAIPRRFDRDLFRALVNEFDPGFPAGQFRKLERFAFVNRIEGERKRSVYLLHQRAREALRDHAKFFSNEESIHEFLLDYHTSRIEDVEPVEITSAHEEALEEAVHHGLRFMEPELFWKWLLEKGAVFSQSSRWQVLENSWKRLLSTDKLKNVSLDSDNELVLGARGVSLSMLGNVKLSRGEYSRAETLCNEAIQILRNVKNSGKLSVKYALNTLGSTYIHLGHNEKAKEVSKDALNIDAENEDVAWVNAESMNVLGQAYLCEGKSDEALTTLKRAKENISKENQNYILILANLGEVYHYLGKYKTSKKLIKEALKLNKKQLDNYKVKAKLLFLLSSVKVKEGQIDEAHKLAKEAMNIQQSILRNNHPEIAETKTVIAVINRKKNNLEKSESMLRNAIKIGKQEWGKENIRYINNITILGGVLRAQNKYDKALELLRESQEIMRDLMGKNHPLYASVLQNLGRLYLNRGNAEEAKRYLEEAHDIHTEEVGKSRPEVASDLWLLGRAQLRLENASGAESSLKKALQVRREVLDDQESLTVGSISHYLGRAHLDQGNYQEADTYLKKALEIRREEFGEQHPAVASTLSFLGGVDLEQDHIEGAKTHFNRELEIREALDESHPSVANVLSRLGNLYRNQGEEEKAETHLKEALRIRRRNHGENHPKVAATLHKLGQLYLDHNRLEEAESRLTEALGIRREKLGDHSSSTLKTMHHLGRAHLKRGKGGEAKDCFAEALEVRRERSDEDNLRIAATLQHLGRAHLHLNEAVAAGDCFTEELEICSERLGDQHPSLAGVNGRLAAAASRHNDMEKAEMHLKEALRIRRRNHGENHPKVAATLHNLGQLYLDYDRPEEAEARLVEALEICREKLSRQHPRTGTVLHDLGGAYREQDALEQAEKCFSAALEIRENKLGKNHSDTKMTRKIHDKIKLEIRRS